MQATRVSLADGVKGAEEQAKKMRARADTAEADGLPSSASVSAGATAPAATASTTGVTGGEKVEKEWPPPKDEP